MIDTVKRDFVLIPGLWAGAWIWDRVTGLLRGLGHRVRPVTLSGLAPGEGDPAGTGPADHVDDVVRVLKDGGLRDAVLVAHCYGGVVAGQVADREPGLVAHTVFVEAFLPHDGRSVLHAFPERVRAEELRLIAESGGLWPPPHVSEVAEGQDLSEEDARRLAGRLVGHPGRTVSEPVTLRSPLSARRATYVVCARDHFGERLPPDVEAMRDAPAWSFRTLDTGHWPMLSAPAELVAVLTEVAAEAAGETPGAAAGAPPGDPVASGEAPGAVAGTPGDPVASGRAARPAAEER
ncbi:alpha/beta hydrolase [Planomonospora sp. ID91781]|uniref:alpha/beta fold hydrolase n=1 Tax=Planomonospora sp. ID91781 TaxID=2738135 RepID=UPI0018C3E0F2|nr:alpha/beta hydrolase [Planomonospora sp. ID91781]MBG0823480.1 alpha/beta hydrolase [Planomonospora sp. ID91781]